MLGYRWLPHPFKPELSRVEIVPEEAELVRHIFQSYAQGQGYKAISNRLNWKGCLTKRGKSFSPTSIHGILTNRNYIGQITYGIRDGKSNRRTKKIVQSVHNAIIEMKLWDQVQEQLAGHSLSVVKKNPRPFPLSGLLKCPACGKGMVPAHVQRTRKNGNKTVSYYYICGNYASHGLSACRAHHIPAGVADQQIENQIALFLNRPAIAEMLITEINQRHEREAAPFLQKLKQIAAEETSFKSRILRCYELFEDGHIDGGTLKLRLEDFRRDTESLQAEKEKLERTISSSPEQSYPSERVRKVMQDMSIILKNSNPDQRKELYRSLIQSIIVPPDRDMRRAVISGNAGLLHLNIPFQ